MAGAGYKLFNTGDVLTAAQVNTYLQEQSVMVFASAAARTTALSGVLAEGMMSYLQDTNAVEVYNGSSWVNVGNAGDITEVQAGTGISVASGTGPIPVVTNSMATTIDAKGDLIVGTGADTFARLAVGATNGHTLQVDSSTSTGLKWAAATLPASTSYTPTPTNFTIGNGSFTTAYIETTDLVYYYGKVQFGSTSTFSSSIRISFPVNAGITYVGPAYGFGEAVIRDVSTGDHYPMLAWGIDATTLGFYPLNAGGTYTSMGTAFNNTTPITLADGDQLCFKLWYRKA